MSASPPRPAHYAALGCLSTSVLLWEVLLTRIYSVTLYYHFAFMVVSLAMFGLTIGALCVALQPQAASFHPLDHWLARLALWTGLLMVIVCAIQLQLPLRVHGSAVSAWSLLFSYTLSSLPFIPAGAFICLALTRFHRVGALYAWDLLGAGVGCALLPAFLRWFGGPGAVVTAGAIACLAAAVLWRRARAALALICACLAVGLLAFAAANRQGAWLRVRWRHDGFIARPLYERWNAFSRIMVTPFGSRQPFGWGIAPERLRHAQPIPQLRLEIDAGASTPITAFDGHLERVAYLRDDITGFAHHLRPRAETCVIGAGGGRDVLTALVFHQPRVLALEVNPEIVQAVNGAFGDFSGHLDRRPDVRFVADEARSYLARHAERFDIIQASLVDTAAATASGAYAFVENGLYTIEGWRLFLSRLKPRGILTVSRWYYGVTTWPVETYRSVILAASALRSSGVADPSRHVLLIRTKEVRGREGLATLLVSPDPFSDEDAALARQTCATLDCEVALSWREAADPILPLLSNLSLADLHQVFPLDVSPPTDDRPYFFFHVGWKQLIRHPTIVEHGGSAFNLSATRLLRQLLLWVVCLGLVCVLAPPIWLRLRGAWTTPAHGAAVWPCYFAGIGLAFMCVEIGLMQRLSVFLGHPTFGFTVTLLGLLVSSGIGSLLSEPLRRRLGVARAWWLLAALVPALMTMEAASRVVLQQAVSAETPVRILLALAVIAPPAMLMGCPFPLGMGLAQRSGDQRTAWYWAINGALSVVGSVVAMLCALGAGIYATLWLGILLYAVTALLYRSCACDTLAAARRRSG